MYDLILIGATIADGSGAALYRGNVCVQADKIACITEEILPAKETVDVSGLVIAPGFIDPHSHADVSHLKPYPVYSQVAQGVTTEIVGNCGTSVMPTLPEQLEAANQHSNAKRGVDAFASVSDYAQAGREKGSCLNYGTLIGHSNLRIAVMGFVNRDPDANEMEQLKALLDREMQRGAFGMSLGLIYPPSAFSKKEELIELAKVIAKHNGILSVHMRNEGPRIFEAVQEMLDIAEASGVHVQISHLKLMGKPQWGKNPQLLKMLTDAREKGLKITCDQYPFCASSTGLAALVPHWAHEGGNNQMVQRLKNREGDICRGIATEMENRGGPQAIMVKNTKGVNPQWEGKFISQLAEEFGLDAVETVLKLLISCGGSVSCIYFSMNERDMLEIMKQNFVCVGSDGESLSHDPKVMKTSQHPRNYSAFTRFFQTVREEKLMDLAQAVYKVTALPASVLGIRDRGLLQEGKMADLVVFDPDAVGSDADFMEARVWPKGVRHVLVNGRFAVRDGKATGENAGTVLLKTQE